MILLIGERAIREAPGSDKCCSNGLLLQGREGVGGVGVNTLAKWFGAVML